MSKVAIVKEFGRFLIARKKFWLIPICLFAILFGAIIIFSEGSAIAPLIYAFF